MIAPYEDGEMMAEAQGPFAPETLASDVYSRRFVGTPLDGRSEYLIVTDYYAVTFEQYRYDDEDAAPVYVVVNATELCWTNSLDDPGRFEVDSDYYWHDLDAHPDLDSAEQSARSDLEGFDLDTWTHLFTDDKENA